MDGRAVSEEPSTLTAAKGVPIISWHVHPCDVSDGCHDIAAPAPYEKRAD